MLFSHFEMPNFFLNLFYFKKSFAKKQRKGKKKRIYNKRNGKQDLSLDNRQEGRQKKLGIGWLVSDNDNGPKIYLDLVLGYFRINEFYDTGE